MLSYRPKIFPFLLKTLIFKLERMLGSSLSTSLSSKMILSKQSTLLNSLIMMSLWDCWVVCWIKLPLSGSPLDESPLSLEERFPLFLSRFFTLISCEIMPILELVFLYDRFSLFFLTWSKTSEWIFSIFRYLSDANDTTWKLKSSGSLLI